MIFQFQKQGSRIDNKNAKLTATVTQFINRKKIIAVVLVPLFFIMAAMTLFNWITEISWTANELPSLERINNLFFDEFFTVLILVDVILLLISFFYTDQFHKIIRNSGFVVSTILIRLSFGASGLIMYLRWVLLVLRMHRK